MNSALKSKILDMKKDGLSYAKISKNTIKSFLRRNGAKCKSEVLCKNCRKPLENFSRNGMMKFCSGSCRYKWWNKNADGNRKYLQILTCKSCGEKFKSYNNKIRKYCSYKCYVEHRFKNSKECSV